MSRSFSVRRSRLAPVTGWLAIGVVASTAAALGGSAIAQRPPDDPRAVFDATHLPPLLTLTGEEVRLTYDVHCAASGVDDPERGCAVDGTVFVRAREQGTFRPLPLEREIDEGSQQLVATVPDSLASIPGGFEYYAELETDGGDRLVLPPGGADAPYVSRMLRDPAAVDLGGHGFGSARQGTRVAAALWGNGPFDVGLEEGRNLAPVGASAFDVNRFGTIYLLDEAHRRMLQWNTRARAAKRVPLSIDGRLADMAVADDGSIYVLESAPAPGTRPLVRRFDGDGRELDVVETAERTPSQIRVGPNGPVVLQQPSHQWMPVASGGSPLGPAAQRRRGRSSRMFRSGAEGIVLRRRNEILAALLRDGDVERSWRITSRTPMAEVQLAEPIGTRMVLVVRVYDDDAAEFVALVLDRTGIAERFSVSAADWAEAAPLGRFRLVGRSLFRLGSTASEAFVDRFDLEAR